MISRIKGVLLTINVTNFSETRSQRGFPALHGGWLQLRYLWANQSNQSVSVLIPVCGVDEGAWDNWHSFCLQDYEHYEVLFGVMHPYDPAVPLLEQLVAINPSRTKLGCWHSSR